MEKPGPRPIMPGHRSEMGQEEWLDLCDHYEALTKVWEEEVRRYGDQDAEGHMNRARRDGFIHGYLRAYDDTKEYGMTVDGARLAYGKWLMDGGDTQEPKDVEGW